jgi:enoyl-CoA hydratase
MYDLPNEITVEERGTVRLVTLNRPNDLNAADTVLHAAIARLWSQIDADLDARVVVLTGAGKAFSAGGDFAFMQSCLDSPDFRDEVIGDARRIVAGMINCRVPIVAAVNGPAVGLGASLAILSDIVLMAPTAFLADPHLQVGLAPGDGGVAWALHAGVMRAKELLLLGDRVPAEQAVAFGLASRVVEGDVVAEAIAVAERLAALPAEAVQGTRRALNGILAQQLPEAFEAALQVELRAMASPDHREIVEGIISRAKAKSAQG